MSAQYVQGALFDFLPEFAASADSWTTQDIPGGRARSCRSWPVTPGGGADGAGRSGRPTRRLSHVRVTRDPDVALAWHASHRLSAEITWQLARALDEAQLAELRGLSGRRFPSTTLEQKNQADGLESVRRSAFSASGASVG
jgi:hypothetical protein